MKLSKISILALMVVSFGLGFLLNTKVNYFKKPISFNNKPELHFPFDYLPEIDWQGGTDTRAQFSGEVEYRSYPTMDITIPKDLYSNTKMKEPTSLELLKSGDEITNTSYFDVDKDGKKEKIISLCSVGANHCPDSQLVIKDNTVIFSLVGKLMGGSIDPTATGNGFYANWYTDKDFEKGLCCSSGNTRTRFIYKDNIFIPIFEQRIGYIEVNN